MFGREGKGRRWRRRTERRVSCGFESEVEGRREEGEGEASSMPQYLGFVDAGRGERECRGGCVREDVGSVTGTGIPA